MFRPVHGKGTRRVTTRKTFYGVQLLRGLAAILVVCFHVASNLSAPASSTAGFAGFPILVEGNGGVDLFFLISGFVIVWTTKDNWQKPHSWSHFLERRLLRILPLYWALTTGKVLLVLVAPELFRGSHLQVWNTIASYLLIPSRDAEGRISPIISAGWTLCFEMAFYYVCAMALALRRRPIVIAAPLLIGLGLLGTLRTPHWDAPETLVNPLLLEFVAGMVIADLARRDKVRGNTGAMIVLFLAGMAALLASGEIPRKIAYDWRVLVWGGPACLILYAVVALEPKVDFRRFRLPLSMGDASYSIYLTHVLVLPLLLSRARTMHLGPVGQWCTFLLLVIAGIVMGMLVWWTIERRLVDGVTRYVQPMRAAWGRRSQVGTT